MASVASLAARAGHLCAQRHACVHCTSRQSSFRETRPVQGRHHQRRPAAWGLREARRAGHRVLTITASSAPSTSKREAAIVPGDSLSKEDASAVEQKSFGEAGLLPGDGYVEEDVGVSFSAAGLLFPYHVGAARALMEYGHIRPSTFIAGSSAGAIIAAMIHCGISWERQLSLTKQIYANLKANGYWLRLEKELRALLLHALPEDAHERCSGRMAVSITHFAPLPKGKVVTHFSSKEDLVDAIVAGCYTPFYAGLGIGTNFRGQPFHSDGVMTHFITPTGRAKEIVVVPTPWPFARTDISPTLQELRSSRMHWRWHELTLMVFYPHMFDDDVVDKLCELGYEDVQHWEQQGRQSTVPFFQQP
eukprot:jgi/Mesvir1/15533/Mv03183-RA.1